MTARWLGPVVWLLLVLMLAVFVWPTRWRYDHMTMDGNIVPVRMDRFSNHSEMLLPDEGWVPVRVPPDSTGGAMPAAL